METNWTVIIGIGVIAGYFLSQDAKKRDMNSTWWFIFGFSIPILAVIIYLFVKKPKIND